MKKNMYVGADRRQMDEEAAAKEGCIPDLVRLCGKSLALISGCYRKGGRILAWPDRGSTDLSALQAVGNGTGMFWAPAAGVAVSLFSQKASR
jgi:hypothetical protein